MIRADDLKKLLAEDRDLLKTIVEETLQQVLEAEMDEALQASKGERTAGRLGYRAGYYNRMLVTRVGHIELRVPQDRQGRFRTEVFERYQRSEKALVAAMLEMYVQGVSTRKVKTITEELCGHEFSSSTISRIVQKLDEELAQFAQRRLEEPYPYLILEARQDLSAWLLKWGKRYAKLCAWVEENIEETLSFYRLPRQHHKNLKSTNMLERLMEEIKRRTLVVRIFPNAPACLRLVRALAVETHENWIEAMQYLNMDPLREQKKEALRKLGDAA